MKRTPLKRGESQLKRTPMKKRLTRKLDTPESLAIRKAYREANQSCEVTPFLRQCGQRVGDFGSVEIHHICGGNFGRLDLVSNLIAVSRPIHRLLEDDPWHGRTICLIVKFLKQPSEINADEFRRCSGQLLKGWLENHNPGAMTFLLPYRERLLESLEAGT